ncbi:diacylglycerol kinase theta [Tachysurus ichikawai]
MLEDPIARKQSLGLPEWAGLRVMIEGSGVARQSRLTSRDRMFKVDMATDGMCNFMSHEKCLKHMRTVCSCMAPTLVRVPVAHCFGPAGQKKRFCCLCRKNLEGTSALRCEGGRGLRTCFHLLCLLIKHPEYYRSFYSYSLVLLVKAVWFQTDY